MPMNVAGSICNVPLIQSLKDKNLGPIKNIKSAGAILNILQISDAGSRPGTDIPWQFTQ
jgi:hypothetical protein